jgi:alkylation response protein AidB-like acyl-CoA dehydrogenase
LEEEEAILQGALSRLLGASYSAGHRRAFLASDQWLSRSAWRAFADMGLLGASLPTEYGGDGNAANLMTIARAFGRYLVVEPFLPTVILGGNLVAQGGSEPHKQALIPRIVGGDLILAVAYAEPRSRFNLANVSTVATEGPDGFSISGRKSVVYGGPAADKIIVSARTSGGGLDRHGVTLFLIDSDRPGLTRRDYRTLEGMAASDIDLDRVQARREDIVGVLHEGLPLLASVIDLATAAVCAEAIGLMEAASEQTLEHCRTRVVFGQPLSKFQSVQHQLVDMQVALAHAEAIVRRAYAELDQPEPRRAAAVSAAKVQLAKEIELVGKVAVQLHGAMGITDEVDVSHHFKRLTMIGTLFGNADHHLRRYIESSTFSPMTGREALESVTDLAGLTDEELAFRDTVRCFYDDNLTDELRRAAANTLWHMTEFEYGRRWQEILFRNGYGAPEWPVEYGGCDWTSTQRLIWNAETVRARAPLPMGMGRVYCGPCIMKFGSQAQKDFYLPRIISGEDWWAQGYSEPGAGSDLATLQLSAVVDGDDYVLNGSKIWTTFAHHANRIFCLVRTSTGERKQFGITFLLIDMDSPGIEVRPIVNLAGDHDFNQVFFTDVRVPRDSRLGEEDQGWTVARHLLLYEHGANLARANMENVRRLGWLREIGGLEDDGYGGRLLDDVDFARHVAEVEIELQAVDFASRQEFAKTRKGEPPGSRHELLTLRSRSLGQRLTELAMQAVGYYGAPHQPDARRMGVNVEPIGPPHAVLPMPFYLTQRGATIAGGALEIHKNNLAKHLLHL